MQLAMLKGWWHLGVVIEVTCLIPLLGFGFQHFERISSVGRGFIFDVFYVFDILCILRVCRHVVAEGDMKGGEGQWSVGMVVLCKDGCGQ